MQMVGAVCTGNAMNTKNTGKKAQGNVCAMRCKNKKAHGTQYAMCKTTQYSQYSQCS